MKKLIFSLMILVCGFTSNAQMSKATLEKVHGPLVNVEIPANVQSKAASANSVVLPFYKKDGKVVLAVINETGFSGIYTSPGVVLKTGYRELLSDKIKELDTQMAAGKVRCNFFCWIKIIADALCTVFDCSVNR